MFSSGFFSEYSLLLLVIHNLGTVLGMGGALISDILFFSFLSDGKISRKEVEVLHVMKSVVLYSLAVILLSGIGMVVSHPQRYIGSTPFLIKMTMVVVITLNGIALHFLWIRIFCA